VTPDSPAPPPPEPGPSPGGAVRAAVPILALDVPDADGAWALLERVPDARWVKVGLQLFVAEGPSLVRALVARDRRVFLDLKLHDIPNTVAHAVRSAAALGAELLTVHASGGRAMLRAASEAAGERGGGGPALLAVTLLTSLSDAEAAEAWGRSGVVAAAEVARLARLAAECGMDGVVASVHEIAAIRAETGASLRVLTPGIRLPGDDAGDQARVATPERAARLGADFLVLGRSVTAAPDPAAAWERVRQGIIGGAGE
jgi:orotidine-5'-phosphate decarboxylase